MVFKNNCPKKRFRLRRKEKQKKLYKSNVKMEERLALPNTEIKL